jgi:putative addiction module component (TIGR02574 family)
MSGISEQICRDALSLPRDARAEIAHRLLTSLESEDFPDSISDEWRSEIERRRQQFREGTANPVPAEEALRRAYAAIE